MSEHDGGQEVLRLQALKKSYNVGKPTETEVLHGLDLRLQRSDFVALVGASGSGKSTLLNLIGLLDRPTAGELFLLGEATSTMDDSRRTAQRGSAIGFVFQFHHLIQAFTALENVLMPLMVATGKPTPEQLAHGRDLLAQVGRGDYLAVQAFVDPGSPVVARLEAARVALRDRLRVATTLGLGPRFLHSTGQLHKGGPDTGVFVQVVADHDDDVAIPGAPGARFETTGFSTELYLGTF